MLLTAHFWPAELRSPEDATAAGWIILLSVLAIGLPFGLGRRLGPRPKFSWPRYFFFVAAGFWILGKSLFYGLDYSVSNFGECIAGFVSFPEQLFVMFFCGAIHRFSSLWGSVRQR